MARKKKRTRENRTVGEGTEKAKEGQETQRMPEKKSDNVILMGAASSTGGGTSEEPKQEELLESYITEELQTPPADEAREKKGVSAKEKRPKKEEIRENLPSEEIEDDDEGEEESFQRYNLGKIFLGLTVLLVIYLFFGSLFNWFGPVDIHYSVLWPLLLLFVGFSLFRVGRTRTRTAVGVVIVVLVFLIATGLLIKGGSIASVLVSGTTVEEERNIPDFSGVIFKGMGNLKIVHGDEFSVVVEADENILSEVLTEVEGGTLVISYDNSFWNLFLFDGTEVNVTVTTPDVENLTVTGVAEVTGSDISGESLEISLSGETELTLGNLDVQNLTTRISGIGNVVVSGHAARELVYITGSGEYNGEDLVSDETGIRISGTGKVLVHTLSELNVGISGSGTVVYIGEPNVTEAGISGSGSVEAKGSEEE